MTPTDAESPMTDFLTRHGRALDGKEGGRRAAASGREAVATSESSSARGTGMRNWEVGTRTATTNKAANRQWDSALLPAASALFGAGGVAGRAATVAPRWKQVEGPRRKVAPRRRKSHYLLLLNTATTTSKSRRETLDSSANRLHTDCYDCHWAIGRPVAFETRRWRYKSP